MFNCGGSLTVLNVSTSTSAHELAFFFHNIHAKIEDLVSKLAAQCNKHHNNIKAFFFFDDRHESLFHLN